MARLLSYTLWKRVRPRRAAATLSLLIAVGRSIVRVLGSAGRSYVARRELTKLAALSDRELRDIGLGPYDLVAAANAPLVDDPTQLLADIVRERRTARRAQALETLRENYAPGRLEP